MEEALILPVDEFAKKIEDKKKTKKMKKKINIIDDTQWKILNHFYNRISLALILVIINIIFL